MANPKDAARGAPDLPPGFEAPGGLEPVGAFACREAADEAGLAILAMGRAYWTLVHQGVYIVCVLPRYADAVRDELHEVERLRRRGVRSVAPSFDEFEVGWRSFIFYGLILIGFFVRQQVSDIATLGRVDAAAMMLGGEWWRAVTALTLHADVVHLVSNCVAGAGFALFVTRFFGAAAGWTLILLAGVAGNCLNAWVNHPDPHLSLGASTAVFGALGLLTGVAVWIALLAPEPRLSLPKWLVPLFGGLTLLGWLGVGDQRVDVAAHISGFLCGGALGFAGAIARPLFRHLRRRRTLVGAIPLLVVAGAWIFAFASKP